MSFDEVKGKAKEAFGEATGDQTKQAEGKLDQVKSDVKDKADEVKEKAAKAFNDATNKNDEEQ